MTKSKNETVYFERGAISVTKHTLTTRFKDEALAPIQSVKIGRDPLWMAGVVALGLMLFANRFGGLLFLHEQILLVTIGIVVAIIGYCTATLQIGQHMRERTVLVAPIWTISAVRRAIAKARDANGHGLADTIIVTDETA